METGWLIEDGDSSPSTPDYFFLDVWEQDGYGWSSSHLKALRFARREDASAFARWWVFDRPIRIAQHAWGKDLSCLPEAHKNVFLAGEAPP